MAGSGGCRAQKVGCPPQQTARVFGAVCRRYGKTIGAGGAVVKNRERGDRGFSNIISQYMEEPVHRIYRGLRTVCTIVRRARLQCQINTSCGGLSVPLPHPTNLSPPPSLASTPCKLSPRASPFCSLGQMWRTLHPFFYHANGPRRRPSAAAVSSAPGAAPAPAPASRCVRHCPVLAVLHCCVLALPARRVALPTALRLLWLCACSTPPACPRVPVVHTSLELSHPLTPTLPRE